MSYVRVKLGPFRSYFSRVSDEFEGPVSVLDSLHVRILVGIICLEVFLMSLATTCALVSQLLNYCVLLWMG
jgi:hypothetical protein